jgi:hypothetical protein
MSAETIKKLIDRMKELGDQLDDLEEQRKPLQKEYDELRLEAIPSAFAEDDITSLKGGFGRCTLTSDLYVSVKEGQKQRLHSWLEDGGNGSMIQPTVNAQSLKAFIKEQMKSGVDIPDEILKVTPFSRAVLYKS